MRKFIILAVMGLLSAGVANAEYNDHRGYNVDSLERVAAQWDALSIEKASVDELMDMAVTWRALMKGYKQTNSVKNDYYARKALGIGRLLDWEYTIWDAAKDIGEAFWGRDQYDSASVYYGIALDAIEKLEVVPDDEVVRGQNYSQSDKDDMLSSLYGALGNLYSMQDSIDVAMGYYEKALGIFKEYGWLNSCSVCYYNMAETLLNEGRVDEADRYYHESLDYAKEANDSLWIAMALKGAGQLYMSQNKTAKALRCLGEADRYFSLHEDEELFARMETLDFTSQVLSLQKRRLMLWLVSLFFVFVLIVLLAGIVYRMKLMAKEKKETEDVLNETIEELGSIEPETGKKPDFKLNDRELAILKYLSEGRTTPQMAEALFLSPETIKWYRKKLLVKFDATSSAELVRKAMDKGLI